MHIDHGVGHVGERELVEHMVEQRLAGHGNQWLRHGFGERAHAQPEAGSEHHGFGGFHGHDDRSRRAILLNAEV